MLFRNCGNVSRKVLPVDIPKVSEWGKPKQFGILQEEKEEISNARPADSESQNN